MILISSLVLAIMCYAARTQFFKLLYQIQALYLLGLLDLYVLASDVPLFTGLVAVTQAVCG
jgi:hypothetical protein